MRAFALFTFLAGTALAQDTATLVHTGAIEPRSTFEVRFNQIMVPPEAVGNAGPSPMVIRPALAGQFVWQGQHSGVFTPSEVPPLNTTFQFTLAPDLKTAAGELFEAEFEETRRTPLFRVKGRTPQYNYGENTPALPNCALLFNVAVDAKALGQWIYFTNQAGEKVPATVTVPTVEQAREFSRHASDDSSTLTWPEQFDVRSKDDEIRLAAEPRPNLVRVTPAQPLPPGAGWTLVAEEGLPGPTGLKLLETTKVSLGTVRPFVVGAVVPENSLTEGRRLVVNFSKEIAEEVKPENFRRWFTITPEPEHLKAERRWNSAMVFSGDFKLNTDYTVTVVPGLPAKEPFVLSSEARSTVNFRQLPPVVALETFNAHQLASGARKLRINAVNVPRVRVTAKLFQPDTVAAAQVAYEKYFTWRNNDDQPWSRVEMEKLPGRMAFEREYPLKAETDHDDTLMLNWDELVGAGQTGVALITVDAVDGVADGKKPGAQAIVQLTDLGIVWKDSPSETFGYVFSLTSGAPIAGAKLHWLDREGNLLKEVTTAADGTARLPKADKAAWLLATHGKDLHLTEAEGRDHFSRGRFHVSWDGVNEDDEGIYDGLEGNQRRVLFFTERPVYKPGETVHLKAIVRDERPGQARLAAGEEVKVEVRDARSRLFSSQKIKISEAGSLAAEVVLPPAPLGGYTASVVFAGDADEDVDHSVQFRVEEYVPNAFEVTIQTPVTALGEEKLQLGVEAKYYMGKPLSKAQVAWSVHAQNTGFSPEGWDGFAFCDEGSHRVSEVRGRAGEYFDQGKLTLGEKGSVSWVSKVPMSVRAPQPRTVSVLTEITDVNQQTISETKNFTVQASEFYLGVAPFPEVLREGDTLPVRLAAVRTDGRPLVEGTEAQVRLLRVDWQTNRGVGAGYSDYYRSTPSFTLVGSGTARTAAVEKRQEAWAFVEGQKPAAEFTLSKPGEYLLEATSKDAGGRDVITTRSLYVYGEGAMVWNYRNPFQIELTPDKEEYVAGDQATILVKTPISGDALVTVERENVRRSFVVKLQGNAPSVTVPIEPGDAPNVYVSVMVFRGAADSTHKAKMPEYRVGYAALTVQRRDGQLTVYAKPGKDQYEPGQEVELNVEALDADGRAVPGAEVTLYAVDEGVLSLMGYETPDPFAYFNERRALAVDTGLTLPDLMPEDQEELEFGNKGYLVGGGGDEDAGAELRKNFIACAYWNAALQTDERGRVSAKFKAPDSLTRYRVIAVAQTARDQFGSGDSAFEINKPVMIEAAPPRFGNVGDKMAARAVVHNTTDEAGEAVVSLDLDATTSSPEPLSRTVRLPAKATLAVDFPVEFHATGEAVWKWSVKFTSAQGATHRDAMESRLKVGYPAPLLRQIVQGRVKAGETDLLADIDPALLDGEGTVLVRFSNSRLLDMREGLNQLLHYPYGCVEQTTSSTLPWLSLRELGPALPELARTETEVQDAIRYGVNRLFSMQTASGGLAYWPGGNEPLLYASAWGGFGIAWARKSGTEVPEEDFARLMKYLSASLRGTDLAKDNYDRSSQCLALFTLAVGGKAEPAYHELFFKNREKLDAQQRAWLALAILEAKGPRDMVKMLLEEAVPAAADQSNWWCSSRTTSTQLMAWCRYEGQAPAVDKLVTELMEARRLGHWSTTQGNAWAVLALGDYVQKVEKNRPAESGAIVVNGERQEFQLGEKTLCWTKEFPLHPGTVPKLVLSHPGESTLFTDVSVEVRPKKAPVARSEQGYVITRDYQRVEDDGKLTPARDLRVGDRILVSLEVTVPRWAAYLAVDDPLPANLEAINPNFTSQAAEGQELAVTPWRCNFQELRTDRALFFIDRTQPGKFQIQYLARVRAAGTATAPAAKVEEMYEPNRCATSDTGIITTAKWD